MPRVLPSQVVDLIDSLFPSAASEVKNRPLMLGSDNALALNAILELAQQIPPELIVLDSTHYAEYVASMATIRWSIQEAQGQILDYALLF